MESKTSFPHKKEKNHNEDNKDQIHETKKLIFGNQKSFLKLPLINKRKLKKFIYFFYMILYYKQMKKSYYINKN